MKSPLDWAEAIRDRSLGVSAGGIFYRDAAKAAMSLLAPLAVPPRPLQPAGLPISRYDVGITGDADDGQDAGGDDQESGQRALLEAAAGGELIDVGGERLHVERPQQQRRRQLLEAIDEHQQRRAGDRRPGERQMDGAR